MAESQISNKIWNIAGVLRDGGVSYGDYLEQITFLLFLKMVDENKKMADIDPELQMFSMEGMDLPENFDWTQLAVLQGEDLLEYYAKLLADLSKRKGMIGEIYRGARNKVEKASLLKKVVDMIDAVDWSSQSEDVKGDIYESLLQRIAQDTKSGAGQYFTPRALINVIVKCVNPRFNENTRIADPCCGSGGFLLAARKYFGNTQSEKLNKALQETVFRGTEYVDSTYRMCLMNLLLHGIGTFNGVPPIKCQDSLAHAPGDEDLCDYVLTNPPFGKKSSQTIEVEKKDKDGNTITVLEKEKDSYTRQDFIATTSNKQLNFVQHIKSMLRVGGQAAVVLPDNVLFEGNAGEVIRKNLLKTCDLHTILRLPTGIFYAQGVKANVVFFEKRPASNTVHTKEVWIYDYRTNVHHTLKQNPLKESDLDDFVACFNPSDRHKRVETYNAETNPEGRWRKFTYNEVLEQTKTSLHISWIKDQSEDNDLSIEELFDAIKDRATTLISSASNLQKALLNQEDTIDVEYSDGSGLLSLISKARSKVISLALEGKMSDQLPEDEDACVALDRLGINYLKNYDGELPKGWAMSTLEDITDYEQPTKYIVHSTAYSDDYETPVLTAGKSFIIGHTNETDGIFTNLPTIIFDDFTTDSKYVDFPFKVKSSAMKILHVKEGIDIKYVYLFMSVTRLIGSTHKRYWISEYCKQYIPIPPIEEQHRIVEKVETIFEQLDIMKRMV